MGPGDRQAVLSFQQSKGLQVTGELVQQTLDALGVSTVAPTASEIELLLVPDRTRHVMEREVADFNELMKKQGVSHKIVEMTLDEKQPFVYLRVTVDWKNADTRRRAEDIVSMFIEALMETGIDPKDDYVPVTVVMERVGLKSPTGRENMRPLDMAMYKPQTDEIVWRPWDGTAAGAVA